MEPNLKAILTAAIKAAYENRVSLQVRLENRAQQRPSKGAQNAPFVLRKTQNVVYESVRRKMLNARLWKKMQAKLARESIERMLARVIAQRERAAADAALLLATQPLGVQAWPVKSISISRSSKRTPTGRVRPSERGQSNQTPTNRPFCHSSADQSPAGSHPVIVPFLLNAGRDFWRVDKIEVRREATFHVGEVPRIRTWHSSPRR